MSLSATAFTVRDVGGRPPTLAGRKRALILDLIKLVGNDRLSPIVTESIQRAADLTIAAQEARARPSTATSAADMVAICALEDAADKALARLGLGGPMPIPTSISTVAEPVPA